MYEIIRRLENLRFKWAYRVIDTRAFGLPHRRRRVFIIATRGSNSPESVLGHTKIESTVRYLGIEVDDALAAAEQIDV